MHSPIHFYLTFNPHLNDYVEPEFTQAHEFFEYLLNEVKKNKKAHAYWGKFIGKGREHKVDLDLLQSIIEKNNEHRQSTHLYITDFKNIWVGKVESVHKNITKDFKTLPFYKGKDIEVWFKILDFTLLECTYESTANKLSELYIDNEHIDLKIDGLSPFTTAVRYPALVQDLSEEMFFDELDITESSHLILKDNQTINNNGLLQVIKNLKTYSIPESIYSKIPHAARFEIESAELDLYENRMHNLKKIAFSYIKAFEIIINDLVIHHLKRSGMGDEFFVKADIMPPKLYLDDHEPGVIPISKFNKNYSINQLVFFVSRAMKSNRLSFQKAFSNHKQFLRFFTTQLPTILKENSIMELRGILAHSDSGKISDEDALAIRNIFLGVGSKGLIHSAYQSFYPELAKSICKVTGKHDSNKSIHEKKSHSNKGRLKLVA